MGTSMRYPIAFALMAIAITSTMDATGYTDFSALMLAPLMAIFWFLEKFSKDQIGLKLGRPGDYGLAVLYPLVVVGAAVAIAAMAGEVQVADIDWPKAAKNMALIAVSTVIGVMITEEGFFRGALWASFKKGGLSNTQVLLWSSVAFGLWHLSWVTLAGGYELAPAFIPIFILNATLLGAVWGALRMLSRVRSLWRASATGSGTVLSTCSLAPAARRVYWGFQKAPSSGPRPGSSVWRSIPPFCSICCGCGKNAAPPSCRGHLDRSPAPCPKVRRRRWPYDVGW